MLFVLFLLMGAGFAHAGDLFKLSIHKISTDKTQVSVDATIENISNTTAFNIIPSLLIQDKDNKIVFEHIYNKKYNFSPQSIKHISFSERIEGLPKGIYYPILTLRAVSGEILLAKKLASINFDNASNDKVKNFSCKLLSNKIFDYECGDIDNSDVKLSVYKTSMYSGEQVNPSDNLPPGKYQAVFTYTGNEPVYPKSFSLFFEKPGEWAQFDTFILKELDKNHINTNFKITSSYGIPLFLNLWIISHSGEVCSSENIQITKDSIGAIDFSHRAKLDKKCDMPRVVALLYSRLNSDGNPIGLAKIGNPQNYKLAKKYTGISIPDKISDYQDYIFIVLGILLLVGFGFLINSNTRFGKWTRGLFIFFIVFFMVSYVSAWTSGVMVLTPSLEKTKYKVNEPITFDTITFQDITLSNSKPKNANVQVSVDGGNTYSDIITASEQGVIFTGKSVPGFATKGTKTIKFKVPGLCGIFGQGLFGLAIFGKTNCTFDLPVVIAEPSPQITALDCNPRYIPAGNSVQINWTSQNTDSCSIVSNPAGYNITNLPTSGSYTINNLNTHNQRTQFSLTCSNQHSSVTMNCYETTYVCQDNYCTEGESCSVCEQDCGICITSGNGEPKLRITHRPALIRPGGQAQIIWVASDVKHCTVSEDNSDINDSWEGALGTTTTSKLPDETTYTLECQMSDDSTQSTSTTVKIAPSWQEI